MAAAAVVIYCAYMGDPTRVRDLLPTLVRAARRSELDPVIRQTIGLSRAAFAWAQGDWPQVLEAVDESLAMAPKTGVRPPCTDCVGLLVTRVCFG